MNIRHNFDKVIFYAINFKYPDGKLATQGTVNLSAISPDGEQGSSATHHPIKYHYALTAMGVLLDVFE